MQFNSLDVEASTSRDVEAFLLLGEYWLVPFSQSKSNLRQISNEQKKLMISLNTIRDKNMKIRVSDAAFQNRENLNIAPLVDAVEQIKSDRLSRRSIMKKRIIFGVVSLLVVVGLFFAGWKIRIDHYPLPVEPSTTWEPFINSLDAEQKSYFVNSDGTMLEADLFIPNGGSEKKPAVIFTPGSGDSDYHNYSYGLVETYILDVFLSHDIAVLLVNKRGMGQSEGNYVKNSIEGRAEDIWAAVQSIQSHSQIDADNIGLIGHSQGGWVVTQAAADHPEIAFFISLAGPTMSMQENAADNFYHFGRCQGLEGEELEAFIEKRLKKIDVSIRIGKITDFGFPGFDARNMSYNPQNALKNVQSPGLFVYAEHDDQVTPAPNLERMNEIFDNDVPENISAVVIDGATHAFRLVNDPCESWVNPGEQTQSEQLTEVLHAWLAEQGY